MSDHQSKGKSKSLLAKVFRKKKNKGLEAAQAGGTSEDSTAGLPPLDSVKGLPAGRTAACTEAAAVPAGGSQAPSDSQERAEHSLVPSGGRATTAPLRRSLHVQVIGARDILAADSNGLSDGYCTVRVGSHKLSTRVVHKTLSPTWNEQFVFGARHVEEEEAHEACPAVHLSVYDWDLVSADDFLGRASLAFSAVEDGGHEARWVQLSCQARGGKARQQGEVLVAAWFAESGEQGSEGGSTATSLCYPLGVPKHVPLVVHAHGSSLYEEPLIVCLGITLEGVRGAPRGLPAGPSGQLQTVQSDGRATDSTSGQQAGAVSLGASETKKASRFLPLPFRRKFGRDASGKPTTRHQDSAASDSSFGLLAFGEDDDDDLNLFLGGSTASGFQVPGRGSPGPQALGPEEEEEEEEKEGEGSVADEDEEQDATPIGGGDAADSLTGHLIYCKLSLGRQVRQSYIRKERGNGTASWRQRFVFACPVPVKNRQVALEVYRTRSSTRKGRLVATAQVWLYDLLPQLLDPLPARDAPEGTPDPTRVHRSTHALQSISKRMAGGQVVLSCVVVDQDERREMYSCTLTEGACPAGAAPQTPPGAAQAATGRQGSSRLQHLQSNTQLLLGIAAQLLSDRERQRKAEMTEERYLQWQGQWVSQLMERTKAAASGYLGGTLSSWAGSASVRLGWSAAPSSSAASLGPRRLPSLSAHAAAAAAAAESGPSAPQPPATLHLKLASFQLQGGVGSDCFLVLKCGPHWGKSAAVAPLPDGTFELAWEITMSLHEPSTLLLVAVFTQPRRGPLGSSRVHQARGPIGPQAPQLVGKLRLRLSCVQPNQVVKASLPLLSERKKGAQQVGAVGIELQAVYPSGKGLMRSYLRPALPEPAYTHGLHESEAQEAMALERRRIVLRWLDTANPSIPHACAMAVLDTEREEFIMSRLKANLRRFQLMAAGLASFKRWWAGIERWDNPSESFTVCAAFVLFAFRPSIVVPLLLVIAALRVAASRPEDAGSQPPRMEQDPPELESEDTYLAATSSNPYAQLKAKYDMLVGMMLRVQNVADDLATALEKLQALGSWQDPIATTIYMLGLLGAALVIFLLGFRAVVAFALFWIARPPRLRTPTPPPPANLFKRLPSRADRIM